MKREPWLIHLIVGFVICGIVWLAGFALVIWLAVSILRFLNVIP